MTIVITEENFEEMYQRIRQSGIMYQLLSYCQEKAPELYLAIEAGRVTNVINAIVNANVALLQPHEVYSQYNPLHRVLSDSLVLILERLNDIEFKVEAHQYIFDTFVIFIFISDGKSCRIELNKNVNEHRVKFFVDGELTTNDKIWSK